MLRRNEQLPSDERLQNPDVLIREFKRLHSEVVSLTYTRTETHYPVILAATITMIALIFFALRSEKIEHPLLRGQQ